MADVLELMWDLDARYRESLTGGTADEGLGERAAKELDYLAFQTYLGDGPDKDKTEAAFIAAGFREWAKGYGA